MDRKLWLLALCVAGLMLVASGQKSETKAEPLRYARYQIIDAQQEQDGKIVLVLDTQAGKVWKYQPLVAGSGSHPTMPEAFILVGFGIPQEGASGFGLKRSASEDSGELK